jgi:hypothetical protein
MKIGTKSVLFGAHCFLVHWFFVALGWWKLYGFRNVDRHASLGPRPRRRTSSVAEPVRRRRSSTGASGSRSSSTTSATSASRTWTGRGRAASGLGAPRIMGRLFGAVVPVRALPFALPRQAARRDRRRRSASPTSSRSRSSRGGSTCRAVNLTGEVREYMAKSSP